MEIEQHSLSILIILYSGVYNTDTNYKYEWAVNRIYCMYRGAAPADHDDYMKIKGMYNYTLGRYDIVNVHVQNKPYIRLQL